LTKVWIYTILERFGSAKGSAKVLAKPPMSTQPGHPSLQCKFLRAKAATAFSAS